MQNLETESKTSPLATALLARHAELKATILGRLRETFDLVSKKNQVAGCEEGWFSQTMSQFRAASGYERQQFDSARRLASDHRYEMSIHMNAYRGFDEAKASAQADEEATAVCLAWYGKLVSKLGQPVSCEFANVVGGYYTLRVRLAGISEEITIQQQVVWKYTNRGLPFAQFPARIYVGGKFTTEAALKKMLAA